MENQNNIVKFGLFRVFWGVNKTWTGSDRIGLTKPGPDRIRLTKPGSDCIRLTKPGPDPKKKTDRHKFPSKLSRNIS